jgi:hypothetical protein
MKVLTVQELVNHIRLQNPSPDTQAKLEELGNTVEGLVSMVINRTWEEVRLEYGGIPTELRHACLMLADYYYQHRGDDSPMPRAAAVLCKKFKKLRR